VAVIARERGEFRAAAATLARALALCERLDIRNWAPLLASDVGYAYAFLRRISDALPLLEQAAASGGRDVSGRLARLSVGYLHADRRDDALATAQRALTIATEVGARGNEADALRILGDVVSHGHQPETAIAVRNYQYALALAEPRGMRPLVAPCH